MRVCSCNPAREHTLHAFQPSSSGRTLPLCYGASSLQKPRAVGRPLELLRCAAVVASNGTAAPSPPVATVVGDVMTRNVITVHPQTPLDDALGLIVSNKITGLPVVDDQQRVVGVVSDWDLLPLEALSSVNADHPDVFPDVNTTWTAFNDLSEAIAKNAGKTVADVMTMDPLVVRSNTALTDAAQILMKSRVRRLPVVDADGKIEGVVSRGNIIAAALAHRQRIKASSN